MCIVFTVQSVDIQFVSGTQTNLKEWQINSVVKLPFFDILNL